MPYKWWIRMPFGVALGAVALVGLAACAAGESHDSGAAAAEAVVLGSSDIAEAQRVAIGTGVVLSGSLEPYRVVDINAQVPGNVAGLRVDRGEAVRQGAQLLTIEADGIRSQAAGAEAAVAAAEANLALARRQLESARTLHDAGALSEIDLRGAEAGYEAARAQVAASRAQAASARETARRATVTAPISGIVSDRIVEVGEAVNPGQKLLTIVDPMYLELAGQVPVEEANRVRVGLPVVFELKAYPGREFRGTVARIDPVADPATRQVGIYVRLPNPEGTIIGGQFATGRVHDERAEEAVVVPESAVREADGRTFVQVVEDGRVMRRSVELGVRDGERGLVAIVSGIEAGERVIAAPGMPLPDGTPVRVSGAAAPIASAAREDA